MSLLKIGIFGEYQSGKSLLINCLLKRAIATVGTGTGTTHTFVSYCYSSEEYVVINYREINRSPRRININQLENLDTSEDIAHLTVYLSCDFLNGIELVDTPGIGYNSLDTDTTHLILSQLDFAIVVLSNVKVISEDSLLYNDFLFLNKKNVPFYWFVNCVDVSRSDKWDTSSIENKAIAISDKTILKELHPLVFPMDEGTLPIVNFMWYWYAINNKNKEDIIIKPYVKQCYADGLDDSNVSDIIDASQFYYVLKLFDMENIMYLQLRKDLKEEIDRLRNELCPPGTIQAFASDTVPEGWLYCDGRRLDPQQYFSLFSAIGYTFGGTHGKDFCLPDLRNRFVRGHDRDNNKRVFGSFQPDAISSHIHKVNSMVTDPNGQHYHKLRYVKTMVGSNILANDFMIRETPDAIDHRNLEGGNNTFSAGLHSHILPSHSTLEPTSINSKRKLNISDETRPCNITLLFCIKY